MAKNLERKTLREWRDMLDWSREKLAREADITLSTMYSAERGSHPPRQSTRAKLAKALGIKQDQIIWPETYPEKR